jgi:hypothetical protein
VASSLPVGRFFILLRKANFEDLRVADIDLHSGDVRTLNERMGLGSLTRPFLSKLTKGGPSSTKVTPRLVAPFNPYRYVSYH